jgi:MFS superfamily sulfate permease-like transporter
VGFGVLEALVVAVGLSLIDAVRRSASPHDAVLGWDDSMGRYTDISVHRKAQVTPHILIYRLDDRLFFANAGYFAGRVREAIRAAPTPTSWLVFDATAVNHVDSTGLEALVTLTANLKTDEITLVMAHLKTRLEEQFHVAGVTEVIGAEHFYSTVHAAIIAYGRHKH